MSTNRLIGVIVACIVVVALIVVLARPGIEPALAIVDRAEGLTTVSGEVEFSVSMVDKDEAQVRVRVEDKFTGQPVDGMAVELVATDTTLEVLLHDPEGNYLPGILVFEQERLDEYPEITSESLLAIGALVVAVVKAAKAAYGLVKFTAGGYAILKGASVPATKVLVQGGIKKVGRDVALGTLYEVTRHLAKLEEASRDDKVNRDITIYVFEEADGDYAIPLQVPAGATWGEIDDAVRDVMGEVEVEVRVPAENPHGAYYYEDGTPKVLYVYPRAPEEAEPEAPEETSISVSQFIENALNGEYERRDIVYISGVVLERTRMRTMSPPRKAIRLTLGPEHQSFTVRATSAFVAEDYSGFFPGGGSVDPSEEGGDSYTSMNRARVGDSVTVRGTYFGIDGLRVIVHTSLLIARQAPSD